jgi:hypothetical protein
VEFCRNILAERFGWRGGCRARCRFLLGTCGETNKTSSHKKVSLSTTAHCFLVVPQFFTRCHTRATLVEESFQGVVMACASPYPSTLTRVLGAGGSHATWRPSRARTSVGRRASSTFGGSHEKSNNNFLKRRSQQLACHAAASRERRAENVPGNIYVDTTCINCDTCRWMSPGVFEEV